jgi:8-oxo-dGTP pyrophosphatase MutT (NUDIX family)
VPPSLATLLERYQPEGTVETADIARVRALAEATDDPWRRQLPLHVTASALIVHPATDRVLLRWHERQEAWLQVGGHGDPGESDPLAIARREAVEETGLADLAPWPDAEIRHVVIVGVPAGKGEPAHEHADIRYFMATQAPDAVRAENENAPLRWLSLAAAHDATAEANLRETLARMERLLPLGQRSANGFPAACGFAQRCALSQAAALAGDARESQASWITSVSSCTVSSPIRLPRTSTDGWASKCGVVKNGDA